MNSLKNDKGAANAKYQQIQETIRAIGGSPTTAWIAAMQSEEINVQRECLNMLEMGGLCRRQLLPTMVAIFQDPHRDAGFRAELGFHIGRIRLVGAVEPLCLSLDHDPYPRIRASAIVGLAYFPDKLRAVDGLLRTLADPDELDFVRALAAEHLAGATAADPVPALIRLLDEGCSDQIRVFAIRTLGVRQDARAIDALQIIKTCHYGTVELTNGPVNLTTEAKHALKLIKNSAAA